MKCFSICLIVICLQSCYEKESFYDVASLKRYVLNADNGLTQSKEQEGIKLSISVWPQELLFDGHSPERDSILYLMIAMYYPESFGLDAFQVSKLGEFFTVYANDLKTVILIDDFQLLKPGLVQGVLGCVYHEKKALQVIVKGIGYRTMNFNFSADNIAKVRQ